MAELTKQVWGKLDVTAAAAIVTKRFIGFDDKLCTAGAKAKGVSYEALSITAGGAIDALGNLIVESGGVFAIGDALVSDSTGRAVKATVLSAAVTTGAVAVLGDAELPTMIIAGSVTPEEINGYALSASTGAGQFANISKLC